MIAVIEKAAMLKIPRVGIDTKSGTPPAENQGLVVPHSRTKWPAGLVGLRTSFRDEVWAFLRRSEVRPYQDGKVQRIDPGCACAPALLAPILFRGPPKCR